MRLLVISNRLPFTIQEKEGKVEFKESSGGLVSGLSGYLDYLKSSSFTTMEYIWVGWPGENVKEKHYNEIRKKAFSKYNSYPVFISEKDMENFYYGFCNKTIWPLFHCFPNYTVYDEDFWDCYKKVNEYFYESLAKILKPDDILWIHDYHLMLLPKLIREKFPDLSIGFFLHIPFPPFEIYRLLPKKWRIEILEGILGSDLVGFHTNDYTQNFLKCVLRLLGFEHNLGNINLPDRTIKVDTFPMGIHYKKFFDAASNPEIQKEKENIKIMFKDTKIILSVDRLDYTKGIINRLQGFELFLEKNPQWHNKVTLLLIVVPSRIGVESYQRMKSKIDELVGKINGKFGSIKWTPIHYQFKYLPFENLVALYTASDIALVTPLRDGMNLVAKEYISTRIDKTGVLILSEMAGAAKELGEAIIINPNHKEEIAQALKEALEMPFEEQKRRNDIMQKRLSSYDVIHWANDFINELLELKEERKNFTKKLLPSFEKNKIVREFKNANSKLILLDYDGTLVPFEDRPEKAKPDEEIIKLIKLLSEVKNTDVVLISGRDKNTLQNWFGEINISLVAEHGIWIKEKNNNWQLIKPLNADWKPKLISFLKLYPDRLPGSFVEEKEFSLVWHYRRSDPELSSVRAKELIDDLISLTANIDVQILQGNKVIEIRSSGVNKGIAVTHIVSKNKYDFILAIGDDFTDEDIFKALPENAYSIKVGFSSTAAKFILKNYKEVRKLIEDLTK
jgi:trehalose 6-phosphate synthase/phosphatase